jgi:peroxiredoxin
MSPKLNTAEAPDFALVDTEGNRVQLSQYRGSKHVVLVFNRGLY